MKREPLQSHHREEDLRGYYRTLYQAWGPQHWWPGETAFEVIVGAHLTQNTAWVNVERALANLRSANALNVESIRKIRLSRLEKLIRPSGYFRQKAKRLKIFIAFLDLEYNGSLERMFLEPTQRLRTKLLELNGVGPETADSILLYAGNHPIFVVDGYTRRVLDRHGILPGDANYEEIRKLFEEALSVIAKEHKEHAEALPRLQAGFPSTSHPPSTMSTATRTALAQVYNEMHGLIVGVGKHYCGKSQPRCDGCPLQAFLPRDN